jgi:hypothetical protein
VRAPLCVCICVSWCYFACLFELSVFLFSVCLPPYLPLPLPLTLPLPASSPLTQAGSTSSKRSGVTIELLDKEKGSELPAKKKVQIETRVMRRLTSSVLPASTTPIPVLVTQLPYVVLREVGAGTCQQVSVARFVHAYVRDGPVPVALVRALLCVTRQERTG